jgi:hypothetical protein
VTDTLFDLPETPDAVGFAVLAADAIDRLAASGEPFTADDVRKLLPPNLADPSPGAMGAAFQAARQRHRIRLVAWRKPARAARHGNRNAVWMKAA